MKTQVIRSPLALDEKSVGLGYTAVQENRRFLNLISVP